MREPRLDPVRRPRLPRAGTTLRLLLVAALLLTAAAALYAGEPTCPPATASATSASPSRTDDGSPPAASHRPSARQAPDARGLSGPSPASSKADRSGPSGQALGGADGGSATRLPAPPGTVGVPVRLADPAALALVGPGDRVDLLASGRQPTVLATDALVLAVALDEGALLLALGSDQARKTAGARPGTAFSVVVRP